jgi:uncharacterized protein YciI
MPADMLPDFTNKPTRFVLFHLPGPAWDSSRDTVQQTGIAEHFAYIKGLSERGIVFLGGPFLQEMAGGMLITHIGLTDADMQAIIRDDPAVQSGLIRAELRSWLVTIDS